MRKRFFNMIEIILAIAIISVGMSSVMVLFVSGLKRSEDTLKDSKLPDAAETAISELRAHASTHAEATGWKSSFDTAFPSLGSGGWNSVTSKQWSDFNNKFKESGKPEKDDRTLISDDAGNYLYRQLRYITYDAATPSNNTYETVFSAIIEARQVSAPTSTYSIDDIRISNPLNPAGETLSETQIQAVSDARDAHNVFGKVRRILEVRVSYPADTPPDLRESKIYRVELFNDKYDGI